MSPFVVIRDGLVPCRAGMVDCVSWRTPAEAWRNLGNVLTWDTRDGAQRFVDMNGGTVIPLSEVFDHTVILPPHGPVQHSPDEAGPLESGPNSQKPE